VPTRLFCFGGAFVTAFFLYLSIWPSVFTLVAIPVLPSPVLFLIGLLRPSLVRNHRSLRSYLIGCLVVAGLSCLYEYWWVWHIKAI
jgi:hypothetical protein